MAGGLIVREREPANLEYPFEQLGERLTASGLFYVRSHFSVPPLAVEGFELKISGAVERPFSIGYEELRAMPAQTTAATLECAGNGRAFLNPAAEGVQWGLGAVGTAEWTGVPLDALLDRAGVDGDACEVVLQGADKGKPKEKPVPPGLTPYARSVALAKKSDVLIAYAINGNALMQEHGFPLRAVVPGHYGMASVKWLTEIRAVREPFNGYFQTSDYAYWDEQDGNAVRRPLSSMKLKSSIARPCGGERLRAGSSYTVFGATWSGEAEVVRVDVSTDDGKTWQAAELLDAAQAFVWRRWRFAWQTPGRTGRYVLKSRATDSRGNVQPEQHDQRFGSYVIDHTVGVEVVVE
jgi:DMSO/TMAO reductase YedYZ molybdopterin-dependent catalytic subunit